VQESGDCPVGISPRSARPDQHSPGESDRGAVARPVAGAAAIGGYRRGLSGSKPRVRLRPTLSQESHIGTHDHYEALGLIHSRRAELARFGLIDRSSQGCRCALRSDRPKLLRFVGPKHASVWAIQLTTRWLWDQAIAGVVCTIAYHKDGQRLPLSRSGVSVSLSRPIVATKADCRRTLSHRLSPFASSTIPRVKQGSTRRAASHRVDLWERKGE
jgi:hypothetical protein